MHCQQRLQSKIAISKPKAQSVNTDQQKSIKGNTLKTMDSLPPENLVSLYTEDQQAYWLEVRKRFEVIHIFFTAYFTGKPIPIEELEGELGVKELYPAKFDYFLAFYNLIQWGWQYIIEESEKTDGIGFLFDSPGDCFIAFLKSQAQAQMHICELGRYDIRPRHRNEMRRLAKKIEEGEASKIQKLNFEKYIKSIKNLGFDKFAKLEIFCVRACNKYAEENSTLKDKLEDYYKKFENLKSIKDAPIALPQRVDSSDTTDVVIATVLAETL